MAEVFGYAIVAILLGFIVVGVIAGLLIMAGAVSGAVAAVLLGIAKAFTQK